MSIYRDKAVAEMKKVFGTDQRRINHAMKVLRFSEEIADKEALDDRGKEILTLTAILHDIGIHEAERKYNSNSGKYQEIEGPPIAKEIMDKLGVADGIPERVCYIIGGHHTAHKNNGLDFQILWEADLLVNIEEEGLNSTNADMKAIIDKNFKTAAGKRIASELYL